jgi:hypothetical protein
MDTKHWEGTCEGRYLWATYDLLMGNLSTVGDPRKKLLKEAVSAIQTKLSLDKN